MNELTINGTKVEGIHLGEGSLSALLAFPPMKANIESKSRLNHGKKVIVNPRYESREVSLTFIIVGEGTTNADRVKSRQDRAKWLQAVLEKGKVEIQVEGESPDIYRLVYEGKSAVYGMNPTRTLCKIGAKFEEPNPNNRSSTDDGSIITK